jgi:hypothetical protein
MKNFDLQIEKAKKEANAKTQRYLDLIQDTFSYNAVCEAFFTEIENGNKDVNINTNVNIKIMILRERIKIAQMIKDDAIREMDILEERFPKEIGERIVSGI